MSPAAAGSTDKGAAHDTVIAQAPGDTRQQPNPLECDANGATGMVQLDGDRIRLIEMVQYKTGRATIKPQSVRLLDQLARLLCSYADVRVEIGVHTDSRGSSAHNLALSQKRAEAVRDYLYSRGVPYERVRAKGYGESAPISHVPSRLHRRTEVKVLAQ